MHVPVLLNDSINALNIKPDGLYIDGTYGRGGHTHHMLQHLSSNGRLIVFDKDPDAIEDARAKYNSDQRVSITHQPFSCMQAYCDRCDLSGKVDGIFLDLGVSSPQLDTPERGFSFMHDGPLDMRMNPKVGLPVSELLKTLPEEELAHIFKVYGQERFAKKVAGIIKHDIAQGVMFASTKQLADLIGRILSNKEKKHPATRCFQALRIYVNEEMKEVEQTIQSAPSVLAEKGRLAIISFHSLEDRIVKQQMRILVSGKSDDSLHIRRGLPIIDEVNQSMKWVIKMQKASDQDKQANIRSRSATLRVLEKL